MTKFAIRSGHIPVNKYEFRVAGVIPITFTSIGSMANEIDSVELPDRTQATGGRSKPGESEVKVPAHHLDQIAACNAWVAEAKDPVSPLYKKVATLTMISGDSLIRVDVTVVGAWLCKNEYPEFEMGNDGEMAEITYTLKWDDLM